MRIEGHNCENRSMEAKTLVSLSVLETNQTKCSLNLPNLTSCDVSISFADGSWEDPSSIVSSVLLPGEMAAVDCCSPDSAISVGGGSGEMVPRNRPSGYQHDSKWVRHSVGVQMCVWLGAFGAWVEHNFRVISIGFLLFFHRAIDTAEISMLSFGLASTSPKVLQEALLNQNFKIIVVDESHYMKNRNAKTTKFLAPLLAQAEHRILLTGTPALSRPCEVSLLGVILLELTQCPFLWSPTFSFVSAIFTT